MKSSRFSAWLVGSTVVLGACGAPESAGTESQAIVGVAASATPWLAQIEAERAEASGDPRHAPQLVGARILLGTGPARASLTSAGARVAVGPHEVSLRAARLGRASALAPLASSAAPRIAGAEVQTERAPGVVEWWRSLPSGLEHGVTIAERPEGEGELELEIAIASTLMARARTSGSVELVDASGARVMSYAHLAVIDADGAQLPAHASVRDGSIVLALDDTDARYPVVIDPMLVIVEEATLFAASPIANLGFGLGVALDADASRALVRGPWIPPYPTSELMTGSAEVFVRSGTSWARESSLAPSSSLANEIYAGPIALSSDGTRALVSSGDSMQGDGVESDIVRVFVRAGSGWTEEAVLSNPDIGERFGSSVALSANASRAVIGIPGDRLADGTYSGCARVFVRTGTSWTEEATLAPADRAFGEDFGNAVALSADGTRALVAGYTDRLGGVQTGSVRVFVRAGTSWTEEAILSPSGGTDWAWFGFSVALTADASRAIIGMPLDDTAAGRDVGSAHVFVRTGTSWAEEAMLVAHDAEGAGLQTADNFGWSVAIDDAGSIALVAASSDDTPAGTDAGSVRVFRRSGATWTEDSTLLIAGAAPFDHLGSVAIAGDGTRAMAGDAFDDVDGLINAGSAHVFTLDVELDPNGTACSSSETCTSGYCVGGVCSADPGDAGTDPDAGASEVDAGTSEAEAGSPNDASSGAGGDGGSAEDGGMDGGAFPLSAPARANCSVSRGQSPSGVVPLLSVVALVLSVVRGRKRRARIAASAKGS